MSRSLRSKPSDLLSISNPIARFCFDRAVWTFGSTIDADLQAAEESKGMGKKPPSPKVIRMKKQMVLDRWIPRPGSERRYRDPAAGASVRRSSG